MPLMPAWWFAGLPSGAFVRRLEKQRADHLMPGSCVSIHPEHLPRRVAPSPESSFCGPCGGSSRDTCTVLNRRGVPHPINFNDGIDVFTAKKAAPSVYHGRTPQFLQLGGNHEPFAARTTHRHRIYFSFRQISTIACTLPSRGLIIRSIPLCSGSLLKKVAKFSSYEFSTVVVSPLLRL
jgi:hypothetical protein